MNLLQQLKTMTTVVADSGDVDSIEALKPTDATTNPSLILQAAKLPKYKSIIESAKQKGKGDVDDICDHLIVGFGCKIIESIPGRISSEVDARLSFDTQASVEKGRKLIKYYEQAGVDKKRVLIKLASTWQGIKAAEILEKEGISCNLTLLFSQAQAIACAEAKVTLISPFVGRILDWYKAKAPQDYSGANDPGVKSVTSIYNYYKAYGYETQIMGASFRNIDEIIELAGCDLLTISPALLNELQQTQGTLAQKLCAEHVTEKNPAELEPLTESTFLWLHNQDAMASEKLAEGIRNFAKDQDILNQMITTTL